MKPTLHPQQTRSSHWPRLSSDALCDAIPAPLPRIHQHSAPVTATPARAPPLVHHPSRASHVTSEAPEEPPLLSPPPRGADGQLAWPRPGGCEVQGQGVPSLRSRSAPGFRRARRLATRLSLPGTRPVFFFSAVFFFCFGCTVRLVRPQFLDQGSKLGPQLWRRRVLTAGPPGSPSVALHPRGVRRLTGVLLEQHA